MVACAGLGFAIHDAVSNSLILTLPVLFVAWVRYLTHACFVSGRDLWVAIDLVCGLVVLGFISLEQIACLETAWPFSRAFPCELGGAHCVGFCGARVRYDTFPFCFLEPKPALPSGCL